MAVAMIGPKFYAWDRNGKPLAFGKLYTYQARTNEPKATYQTEDQITENANPIILNGEGYANVYLDGSYKMVLKDKDDNEIWSSDPVTGAQANEWTNCYSATYISSTSFKVAGNQVGIYLEGRTLRINNSAPEYEYTQVESAVYAAGETTVTVTDAVITTGLNSVCTSLITTLYLDVSKIQNSAKYQLSVSNNIDYNDVSDLVEGVGAGKGAFYLNEQLYMSTEVLAANIDSINLSTMSLVADGVTYHLYRTLKKGDVNLLSSWMPDGMIENIDALPYLERAYAYNLNTIVNDFGGGWWTVTLIDKLFDGSTRPTGLIMGQPDKTVEFEQGVKMTMATVTTGGKYQMFGINGADNSLISPALIGDRDAHLPDPEAGPGDDEQGYGIRVATGAENCKLIEPDLTKFWGDGILWRNSSPGGVIDNSRAGFCRRQGISIIECNGLTLNNPYAYNISGTAPSAGIDVEPDQPTQNIKGLVINNPKADNCDGASLLVALLRYDDTSNPFDITVNGLRAENCLHTLKAVYTGKKGGSLYVSDMYGENSGLDDLDVEWWENNASLCIDHIYSKDPNTNGNTTSNYSTALGFYRKGGGLSEINVGTFGNIKIGKAVVEIENSTVRTPVVCSNVTGFSAEFGDIQIDDLVFDASKFVGLGNIYNPVGARLNIGKVKKEFTTTSGVVSNNEWINYVSNKGFAGGGASFITVQSGFGHDGMTLTVENEEGNDFRITFADSVDGYTGDYRSFDVGATAVFKKSNGEWSVIQIDSDKFTKAGKGYITINTLYKSNTANRVNLGLKQYESYFDTTLQKPVWYDGVNYRDATGVIV